MVCKCLNLLILSQITLQNITWNVTPAMVYLRDPALPWQLLMGVRFLSFKKLTEKKDLVLIFHFFHLKEAILVNIFLEQCYVLVSLSFAGCIKSNHFSWHMLTIFNWNVCICLDHISCKTFLVICHLLKGNSFWLPIDVYMYKY
jgi:hypothetical protein